jgi:ABC-type lipoprotein release transport system permease subunit
VTAQIGIIAVLLAVGLSLVAGLLPAVRAARQDPMRALRYE